MREAICPKCEQLIMVNAPDDADENTLQEIALQTCTCDGAKMNREIDASFKTAKEWAEKTFNDSKEARETVLATLDAIKARSIDKITIKQNKRNYTIDLSKDGMIRIKSKYTEQIQREF